jgi:hypothetical protein
MLQRIAAALLMLALVATAGAARAQGQRVSVSPTSVDYGTLVLGFAPFFLSRSLTVR